jgi:hypothetical protein
MRPLTDFVATLGSEWGEWIVIGSALGMALAAAVMVFA